MTTFDEPTVARHGATDADAPLVVLLHGRGSNEADIIGLADHLPARYTGAAVLFGTLPFDAGVPTTLGRLADTRMLVIHGDQDTVIPRELLDRTWNYLTRESGADTTAVRQPGGHGLSADALAGVERWLREKVG